MLRGLSKIFGVVCLAMSAILAVLDATKSIADSAFVSTPLGEAWANLNLESLNALQVGIQRKLGVPWLWDSVFVNLLLMPAWFVFFVLAIIFLLLGRQGPNTWRKRFGT